MLGDSGSETEQPTSAVLPLSSRDAAVISALASGGGDEHSFQTSKHERPTTGTSEAVDRATDSVPRKLTKAAEQEMFSFQLHFLSLQHDRQNDQVMRRIIYNCIRPVTMNFMPYRRPHPWFIFQ